MKVSVAWQLGGQHVVRLAAGGQGNGRLWWFSVRVTIWSWSSPTYTAILTPIQIFIMPLLLGHFNVVHRQAILHNNILIMIYINHYYKIYVRYASVCIADIHFVHMNKFYYIVWTGC